jgi:type IV pilus assembly protein PilY1
MGNGYNSANSGSGKAVLFILDIETGKLISKLEAQGTPEKSNGLSSVRAVDFNSDNVIDYAYAGDLQGNLWRFDLFNKSSDASTPFSRSGDGPGVANQFAVSFSGKPLYTAIENGKAQPITALPILVRHPSEIGYLVVFGTGRYLGEEDKTNVDVQSVYGIWDNQTQGGTTTGTRSLAREDLQRQTFESASFEQAQQNIRLLSQNPVTWFDEQGNVTKRGWYLDLKVGEKSSLGERVIDEVVIRGQVLFVGTRTPSSDPCAAGLEGWTYGIDPHTGGRTEFQVFDLSGNNIVDMSDSFQEAVVSGVKTTAGGYDITGSHLYTSGEGDTPTALDFGPNSNGRQSWQVVPQEQE